jgi:2-methylisocitrate lyase-like PEP mutase family enzyme
MTSTPSTHTASFRRLHRGPAPLLLVNAWDAASARLFEQAGVAAIATTSAGVAWSLGYPDGESMPRSELVAAAARIRRVVSVPVSVDVERGFGRSPAEVCETVRALADLGVAGINIEDGVDATDGTLVDAGVLVARLRAIRELREQCGIDLFVNARTDAYFASSLPGDVTPLDEARRRAALYVAAGADGVFVPGFADLTEIAAVARSVDAPLNVYAGIPGIPDAPALAAAGVRRISVGCAPLQTLLGQARAIASSVLGGGWGQANAPTMLGSRDLDRLLARAPRR